MIKRTFWSPEEKLIDRERNNNHKIIYDNIINNKIICDKINCDKIIIEQNEIEEKIDIKIKKYNDELIFICDYMTKIKNNIENLEKCKEQLINVLNNIKDL